MRKRRITIICLLICISLCALNGGCAKRNTATDTTATQKVTTTATTTQATTKPTTTKAKKKKADKSPLLQYNRLSAKEKEVYNRLDEAIISYHSYMEEDLTEFYAEMVDRVYFYALLADKPEYYFVRGNSNLYEKSDSGEQVARFDFRYIYDQDQYEAKNAKMERIFLTIKKSLPKKASDFEKAKAVYDYLIGHCEYDYSYTGNSLNETKTNASYADGALLEKKAVCSGYSRAFKWMMDRFSIPCMCVANSEHEWNIVKIEGDCYHIDVTWADVEDNPGDRYFCVTDAEIYQDREKPAYTVPECTVVYNEAA